MTIVPHVLMASLAVRAFENGSTYRKRGWAKNVFIIFCISIVYAFLSHFIMDMIPHWDPNFKWQEIGIPMYLLRKFGPDAILLGSLLLGQLIAQWMKIGLWKVQCLLQSWPALLAGIVSMIPDIVNAFWTMFWPETNWYKTFTYFHSWCHTDIHPQEFWGMILPFVVTFIMASTLTLLAKQPNTWTSAKMLISRWRKSEQVSES